MKNFTLSVLFILCIALKTFSQAGTLDSTFSGDGKVLTGVKGDLYGGCVALQKDDKIIVGGASQGRQHSGDYLKPTLVRYMPRGKIDSTFGTNGKAFLDLKGWIHSIAIQANGKIVASCYEGGTYLIRYQKDGAVDSSFGINGKAVTGLEGTGFVAITSEGKILVGGSIANNTVHCDLERYSQNGKPDSSFGINGKAITDFGEESFGGSIAIQPDGKIIQIGATNVIINNRLYTHPVLLCYKPNGKLYNSFGDSGIVISDFGISANFSSVAVQTDGKIVVAGTAPNHGTPRSNFLTARYRPNGKLDSSFGRKGKVMTDFYGSEDESVAVAIQTNGKIVVAGSVYGNGYKYGLARYNTNGRPDSTFGINGKAAIAFDNTGGFLEALSMVIQPDGNIIVSGDGYVYPRNEEELAIARFKGDSVVSFLENNTNTQKQDAVIKSIDIYLTPNPVKDIVRIQGLSSAANTISIIDNTGKTLQTAITLNSSYSFNVRQLPAGFYFIRIDDKKKITTLTFIKE